MSSTTCVKKMIIIVAQNCPHSWGSVYSIEQEIEGLAHYFRAIHAIQSHDLNDRTGVFIVEWAKHDIWADK